MRSLGNAFWQIPANGNTTRRICDVCLAETFDVARMLSGGAALREVRRHIDAAYARFGHPTNPPPLL